MSLIAIDSHTGGQPTRTIVDGVPDLGPVSAARARELLRRDHDHIRRLAVLEPCAHPAVLAVAVLPPATAASERAIVFMDAAGYPDMCGHATIGVATTLVETGRVSVSDSRPSFTLDTPAGPITVRVELKEGRVGAISLVNQPAFLLGTVSIATPIGETGVAIAYGGQWYAFVDAAAFGLSITPDSVPDLIRTASVVRSAIAHAGPLQDPRTGRTVVVENVMWIDEPSDPEADGLNLPVNAVGEFDRSPCGTGTSARLAVLHASERLAVGDEYVNSGVAGSRYRARILDIVPVAETWGVVPEITGSAWLTGKVELWADPRDPIANGLSPTPHAI
jgi:proline racemase